MRGCKKEKKGVDSLSLFLPGVKLSWWCPEMLAHGAKSDCDASSARAGMALQRENSGDGVVPLLSSGSQHPGKWFLTLNSSDTLPSLGVLSKILGGGGRAFRIINHQELILGFQILYLHFELLMAWIPSLCHILLLSQMAKDLHRKT